MFDFTIKPSITRELLLQHNSQETYLSYYLGLPVKKGLFLSPLRCDKHKTCSFWQNGQGTIYFKDFATNENLDFVGVVMKKYNTNYCNALLTIANDFNIFKSDISKHEHTQASIFKQEKKTTIEVELKNYEDYELKWWNSFGITPKTLQKYKVFSIKNVWINGNFFCKSMQHSPIYGYYLGKASDGRDLWRIYRPKVPHGGMRFVGNVPTKMIQGYKQLPENGKLLIITKSMKDSMCFNEFKIPSCSPNSETQFISQKILDDLKKRFKHILVVFDQDRAGKLNLAKIRRMHPELNYFVIPRKYKAKDFSDFCQLHGKNETKRFIKQFIKEYKWK